LPFPYTVAVAVAVAVAYLFAVYGCNGTEFSYVIFTEQRNLQRQNGETATEERKCNGGNRALSPWRRSLRQSSVHQLALKRRRFT